MCSTMSDLSVENGIPRFFDTCSAAMNCPWFRNPSAASLSVVCCGSIAESLLASCGCDWIFCAIGETCVVPEVVPDVDVVPPVLPVFVDGPCVVA